MADLIIICYQDLGNDGNYPIRDKFLGKVTISTLSATSQSATLPNGTRYVKLVTDASETVFFEFGKDSATATTSSDELNAGQSENIMDRGIGNKDNNTIAARIA